MPNNVKIKVENRIFLIVVFNRMRPAKSPKLACGKFNWVSETNENLYL